jgi:asparagine synthase (glutamine-hydrolysing)
MCGIGGAIGRAGTPARVRAMLTCLDHRGPDDGGVEEIVGCSGVPRGALGHRRLAIIDLSPSGHQPMHSGDGRYSIVFNGEIYNYRSLRDSLAGEGVQFRSTSDTEVILEGWARHGEAFLRRLRGMFAFVLWDRREERAVLARDPFGIKPLYLAEREGALFFSSEVRALLSAGAVAPRLSRAGVASYLSLGSVREPGSVVEGVRSLPAGTVLEARVDAAGNARVSTPREYGPSPLAPVAARERDPARAARVVRAALRDSVAHHLVSDVPIGVFLSGGIDSSVVAALAAESATEPLETFTITFDERAFDEAAPAAAVAQRFGTRHQEIPLSGEEMLASLPAAFGAMDLPSMDGLNTYAVSRAVRRRGLKVVLSGLGGDELFAGYPSFRRARALAALWSPSAPLRLLLGAAAARAGGVRAEKLAMLLRDRSPAMASYAASRALFGREGVRELAGIVPERDSRRPPAGLTTLQQVSWLELTGYMRDTLLRDSDVFSMAHGLELRVPFVDVEVARAAASVDDAVKLRGRRSKPLLVAAVADLLPREVWDRPKQGFTLPFAVWLRGPLRAEVEAELHGDATRAAGLDPAAVRRLWGSFVAGRVSWSRPWAVYTLLRWVRENELSVGEPMSTGAPPLVALAG